MERPHRVALESKERVNPGMPEEGKSGISTKPCNIRRRVNPGVPGEGGAL